MATCNPSELFQAASSLGCLTPKQLEMVKTRLLCQIRSALDPFAACEALNGIGSPVGVLTPEFIGQLYSDTQYGPEIHYRSTGLTSADWELITLGLVWSPTASVVTDRAVSMRIDSAGVVGDSPVLVLSGVQSYTAPNTFGVISSQRIIEFHAPNLVTVGPSSLGRIYFYSNSALTKINLPELVSVQCTGGTNPFGFEIRTCSQLVDLSVPKLQSVIGYSRCVSIQNNVKIETINFPSLVTASGAGGVQLPFWCYGCTLLANLTMPVYVPINGANHTFTTNALTAESVNGLLARFVANPAYVSGVIDMTGGTNSAPTGQGLIDKATLQARGVTVNTN